VADAEPSADQREGAEVAQVKYDVSDVEAGGGGEQPQPALYKGKIVQINERKKKTDGTPVHDLEVVVDVGAEYARLWTYIKLPADPSFEQSKWKLREFTDALGLPSKGGIDPKVLNGKCPIPVNVRVSSDTDRDGEYRGRVKNLLAVGEGGGAVESTATSEGDDEPLTREELEGWETQDLKDELASQEITLSGRFARDKAIDALLEAQGGEEPEPEDDSGESTASATADISEELLEDLKTDEAHYEDWSDEDVESYVKDLGIDGNISGRKSRAKYLAAITSLAESAEGGEGGETEEPASADDYDEWPQNELEDEVNTRNEQGAEIKVSGRKTKEKLIEALRADDAKASGADPF
jgi:hypothetical protein